MHGPIRVLLAEDHVLVRRGFRRLLEDDAAIVVVGEASDGVEAVALATKLAPQVIVMDCAMPLKSGLVATREILRALPDVGILMLTMHSESTLVRQALDAGARGYVLKSALDLDLTSAVKRVAAGERVIDPGASRPVLENERSALTPRELQVLTLICAGRSNREIASTLDVSINTIAVHRANIMSALGIHKTAELVVYALHHGLVNLP